MSDVKIRLTRLPVRYSNFAGRPDKYNKDGERGFNIVIEDPVLANEMMEDGWYLRPVIDEDDRVIEFLFPVKVSYKGYYPPKIYILRLELGLSPQQIFEESLEHLDNIPITWVDAVINQYNWTVGGKSGISAYVQTAYLLTDPDPIDQEYQPGLASLFRDRDEE